MKSELLLVRLVRTMSLRRAQSSTPSIEQPVLLANGPRAGKAEALAQPQHCLEALNGPSRCMEGLEAPIRGIGLLS